MNKSFSFTGRDNFEINGFSVFSEWRDILSPVCNVQDLSRLGSDFWGRLEAWGSSGILVSRISSVAQVLNRNEYLTRFRRTGGLTIIIPMKGKIHLSVCGRKVDMKNGDAVILADDCPYSLNCPEFEVLFIIIPFNVLGHHPCILNIEKVFYLDGGFPNNKVLIDFITGEYDKLKKLWKIDYSVRSRVISKALLDMLEYKYTPRIKEGGRYLALVVDYIRENIFSSDLSLEQMMHDLGLSKHEVSSVLRPLGGIKYCVNKLRIEEAYKTIKLGYGDSVSLNRLAIDLGFKSESTFRRVFREITGYAPSEVKPLTLHDKYTSDVSNSPFDPDWYAN